VFVYQPQTAARHTQWRRYIHRHSFRSEQLDADDETYAPYLHVRFCSVPCITHSRQSYLAFSPNVSCNPFLLHLQHVLQSLLEILSFFLLQHVLQSLLASLTDLGPFLHVRFCRSVFVNHYMHTILVFVYKPQTAARHTQWRRYIHRHSFGSEQLDADDKTWAYDVRCFSRSVFARPFLHVRF
jgi:hypothetical protein